MTTLRCPCGGQFTTRPEQAGGVVVTPCCSTRRRVPVVEPTVSSSSVVVRCPCGQKLRVRKSPTAAYVTCPNCQKRSKVAATVSAAATPDPLGSSRSRLDDLPEMPPAATTTLPRSSTLPTHRGQSRPSRSLRATSGGLPRFGVFEEGFGAPILFGVAVIFLGIFTTLGIYVHQRASTNNAQAVTSEDWVAAKGKILESGYQTRASSKGRSLATIDIRYEYEVDGQTHAGSNLAFEQLDSLTTYSAEARLAPYPTGENCTVYYDPNSPSQSVLEKGARSVNTFNMLMGLAFVLCGVVLAYDCCAGAINVINHPTPATR